MEEEEEPQEPFAIRKEDIPNMPNPFYVPPKGLVEKMMGIPTEEDEFEEILDRTRIKHTKERQLIRKLKEWDSNVPPNSHSF